MLGQGRMGPWSGGPGGIGMPIGASAHMNSMPPKSLVERGKVQTRTLNCIHSLRKSTQIITNLFVKQHLSRNRKNVMIRNFKSPLLSFLPTLLLQLAFI